MIRLLILLIVLVGAAALLEGGRPSEERAARPLQPAPTETPAPGGNAGNVGAVAASEGAGLMARLENGSSAVAAAAGVALADAEMAARAAVLARGAPAVADWIGTARTAALAAGTRPIPAEIRVALRKYYPDALLKPVRYRIGLSEEASLPARLFHVYGRAVTLDDVIVFRDDEVARDPVIWAHEIAHVQQYDRWGVDGFARRYIENFRAVEREAWEITGAWAERQGDPPRP